MVENLPANVGDIRDVGLIPGSGKSPGEGNGNPFQYPCLENSMDGGAWHSTVHRIAELDTTEQLTLYMNKKQGFTVYHREFCSKPHNNL